MASVKWRSCLCISAIVLCAMNRTSGDVIARRQSLFEDKTMSTYLLARFDNGRSVTWCAVMCYTNTNCGSFFYNKGDKWCQLHDVVFITPSDADVSIGTSYFRLTQDWCPEASGYILHLEPVLCYKIHLPTENYAQAQLTCQTEGATLFKAKDEYISFHMFQFLRASSDVRTTHFMVGADDLAVNGVYRWADGTVASWTNWADGEPSDVLENCMALAWFYYFKWNDIPCTLAQSFICQIDQP